MSCDITTMKRRFIIGFLIAVIALMITVPVLASYYANLTVTEANGNDYDNLAMKVSLDVDYLANNGYISATGLDTRVTLSGVTLPHMMVDDTLLFASDLDAYGSLNLLFETGETALSSFPIVVGDGGYVVTSDAANLELADDFEVEFDGYVATDVADNFLEKEGAFIVYSDGGGNIEAEIYEETDIDQTTQGATLSMYAASNTRVGERIDSFPASYVVQLSFYLKKTGSPTGTAYARIRETDDDLVGTLGQIDVSTLTGSLTWYDFTTIVENPSSQHLRFLIEYSGGDAGNKVDVGYVASDVTTGSATYYNGGWTDNAAADTTFKLYYTTLDVSVTAAVAKGEHKITVTADQTDFKIYEDDVEEDTTALGGASVPNLSTDWVLGSDAIPYYDYYTHTTSDTLRITYEPDSIISGTTLPNEENPGTYDGTITFGSNPAGVSVSLGALVSDEQLLPAGGGSEFPSPQDIAGETGDVGLTADLQSLTTNPFYPFVSMISDQTDIPVGIVWVMLATLVLAILFVWLIADQQMMHQMFISIAGGGWVAFCWHLGIYPFWVIFIYAALAVAIVVGERSPTIS